MMKLARALLVSFGSLLVALGLVFLAYPRLSFLHYDEDANSVSAFVDEFVSNSSTGEEPWCVSVPSHTYGLVCLLLALAAFALRREMGKTYAGRIWRGAESRPVTKSLLRGKG